MKAIILAAGYATRLYPLTKDKPKPLLEIKGKPIVDHIVAKIDKINDIDEIFVVTNDKFFTHFLDWRADHPSKLKITIVNDKTQSNDDRLGSLGDIMYVIDNMNVDDDILVIAGDNLFEFSLKDFYDAHKIHKKSAVALYDVKDYELAKQYGIVGMNHEKKMVEFEEKPEKPSSTLASTGIYIYPKHVIKMLFEFLKNNEGDKAGHFLQWLHKKEHVYCYVTEEKWFDIGTLDQLKKANEEFNSK